MHNYKPRHFSLAKLFVIQAGPGLDSVTTDLVHGVPVGGDDGRVAPVEGPGGAPGHRHPDVVLHLRGPGAAVEKVIVPTSEHHPGRLCHQPLLQEVLQAALEKLYRGTLEQDCKTLSD